MYATMVEFPDDKYRMQYMSCAGHEGYWNGCRHSLCHAESCATADGNHFKYFVYEEVYFNPVYTRLTQNISMCFASSVNQMGQTLQ